MSEYKIKLRVSTNKNGSETIDIVDLVDDWSFSEEEAEQVVNQKGDAFEDFLENDFNEWVYENINSSFEIV